MATFSDSTMGVNRSGTIRRPTTSANMWFISSVDIKDL